MKKFLCGVLFVLMMMVAVHPQQVLADWTRYIDGFPIEGVINSSSAVDIYEDIDLKNLSDTLESGTAVTIIMQAASTEGMQVFKIQYTKDGNECTGYVDFDLVQAVDGVITPAPVITVDEVDKNIAKSGYDLFKDFINGLISFFQSLGDILFVLFPFFTPGEIAFLVTMIITFFGLMVYLLIRKVLI